MAKRTRKSSRPVLGRSARPRDRLYSGPEIRLSTGRVGRDTLAAIAEELNAAGRELTPPERVRALARAASSPEIVVRETLASRETLGAIAQELRDMARPAMNTKPYGDRISNAPGARTPSVHPDLGPEISVGHAALGRETLAAINEELQSGSYEEPTTGVRSRRARPAEADEEPRSSVHASQAIEIFEMVTFVARGEVSELGATSARRAFVEERLLHRLPVLDMSGVDRIDVTPWTVKGTVIVRVWCVVPPAHSAKERASG